MEELTLAAALALTGLVALVISWGCMEALLTTLGRLTRTSHESGSHLAKTRPRPGL